MNTGKAFAVFVNIESAKYTEEEKGCAIKLITKLETHNAVTKPMIHAVAKWLLGMARDYTQKEKSIATKLIEEMERNALSKDTMIAAIIWLWDMVFEYTEDKKEGV